MDIHEHERKYFADRQKRLGELNEMRENTLESQRKQVKTELQKIKALETQNRAKIIEELEVLKKMEKVQREERNNMVQKQRKYS